MLCGYPPFYGECDQNDCGWNQGLPCPDCQETLFAKIQSGHFVFPPPEWSGISQDAKNLIKHLLVKYNFDGFFQKEILFVIFN